MSDVEVKVAKVRKKAAEKRTGPACGTTPETQHGCGRPLPISDVPKTSEGLAKLEARAKKLTERLARSKGLTTSPIVAKTDAPAS